MEYYRTSFGIHPEIRWNIPELSYGIFWEKVQNSLVCGYGGGHSRRGLFSRKDLVFGTLKGSLGERG